MLDVAFLFVYFKQRTNYQLYADMAELVDATDLKSVGACPRAGSIPAFRTTKEHNKFYRALFYFGITVDKIRLKLTFFFFYDIKALF